MTWSATCGAKTRAGHPCRSRVIFGNGRCKCHGGLSTGPKTSEGRMRALANLKRGAARAEPHEGLNKIEHSVPSAGAEDGSNWSHARPAPATADTIIDAAPPPNPIREQVFTSAEPGAAQDLAPKLEAAAGRSSPLRAALARRLQRSA